MACWGRRAIALAAGLAVAWWPRPAAAQAVVCLDCFTEILGENPFASPIALPGEWLFTGTFGLATPFDTPTPLPGLAVKVGLRGDVELVGTVGYEPSIGARALLWQGAPVSLLAAGRVGYAYFRRENLMEYALPVLVGPLSGWSLRAEPQFTFNQITGPHVALELAVARAVGGDTTLTLVAQPDYGIDAGIWSGSVSVAASHAITARWSLYGLGSVYMIDGPTPLVALGLTYIAGP